jgi:hypothetical protein
VVAAVGVHVDQDRGSRSTVLASRIGDRQHRRCDERIHLVEAGAGTSGVVAREAGFESYYTATGTHNGDVARTAL